MKKAKRELGHAWPTESRRPDWLKWTRAASVTLDVAAALSMDMDPLVQQLVRNAPEDVQAELADVRNRVVTIEQGRPHRRRSVEWHAPWMTGEGHHRLSSLREHCGTPALPSVGAAGGAQRVTLPDLARFARLQGWSSPGPLLALLPDERRNVPADAAPALSVLTAPSEDAPQAHPQVNEETPVQRQDRRLARLKALEGNRVKEDGKWKASGRRGALADLIREEQDAGRRMSDQHDVRDDLDAAAERDRTRQLLQVTRK